MKIWTSWFFLIFTYFNLLAPKIKICLTTFWTKIPRIKQPLCELRELFFTKSEPRCALACMATVEAARPNSSTSVEFQTRDLSLTTALSFARRPPWIRQVKIWHLTIWSFEQSNTTSAAFTASMWVCCSGRGCCCSEAAPDVEATRSDQFWS